MATQAPHEFFLKEDAFQAKAFSGQESHLYSAEGKSVRAELMKVLTNIYSNENLEFLNDVHDLNSQKDLSTPQLKAGLAALEKKYIASNAPSLINIEAMALNKIRNSKDKSLADYQDAVKEVFKLINTNVNGVKADKKDKLIKLDEESVIKAIKKSALDVAADFNNLTAVVVAKPGLMDMMRQVNRDATLMISCQQTCKTAQRELRQFASREDSDADICKLKMNAILDKTTAKLSAGFQQMAEFEIKNGRQPVFSDAIQTMLKSIATVDVKINFGERSSSQRGISATSKSDSVTPEENNTPESSVRMRR
jgi:hypothetical protein